MAQVLDKLQPDGATLTPRDPYPLLLRLAWRRKPLVILGVVIGLGGSAFSYAQRTPVYQAMAQVLVVKKSADTLALPGAEQRFAYYQDDSLATHQALLKSPLVLRRAVKKPELQGLKSLSGQADPAKVIAATLLVGREKDSLGNYSNLLNLVYRGPQAEECDVILNAVLQSYREVLEATYQNVSAEAGKLITQAKDEVQKNLASKEAEYRQFRQQAPLLWKGQEGNHVHQLRLASIESKRSALLVRRGEIQGHLEALEKALKAGRSREVLLALLADGSGKLGIDDSRRAASGALDEQLLTLLQQEQVLLQDYGRDSPQVQSLRKRLQLLRDYRARRTGVRGKDGIQSAAEDTDVGIDPVQLQIETLQQELEDIRIVEQRLAELFEQEREEARKLLNYEIQDETFRNDIQRVQQLYDGIIKRLQEIDIVKGFGGFEAQTISPAEFSGEVVPRVLPLFALGTVLGALGGLGLAYLVEVSDKRFRG